jgi:hypothetical protein
MDGNANILTEYFQLLFGRKDIKVVFFGDHVHADIQAVFEFDMKLRGEGNEARWDAIAIVEDLYFEDKSSAQGVDP